MTFKRIIIGLALLLGVVAVAQPAPAFALFDNAKQEACQGVTLGGAGNCDDGGSKLTKLITTIVNFLSVVGGMAAVIMIIVGGFKYITSGGDSGNITSAKHTLTYAVLGLVVVAIAQIIVRFVINTATK